MHASGRLADMRQIVLDTETTGLEPELGHRIIEIGCVELVNRRPTDARSTSTSIRNGQSTREHSRSHALPRGPSMASRNSQRSWRSLLLFVQRYRTSYPQRGVRRRFLDAELSKIQGQARTVAALSCPRYAGVARSMHQGSEQPGRLCKRYSIDNSPPASCTALAYARILARRLLR